MQFDSNREKYETAEVVSFYEQESALQPSEAYLFLKYVRPGLRVLDIGVGAGRTTSDLSAGAADYVGVDYSQAMIDACRRRFPHLKFYKCDATEMSRFTDGEFDLVVFSYNGIDVIRTDGARRRCLSEAARVLKCGGLFIFSSHNARALAMLPNVRGLQIRSIPYALARSVYRSMGIVFRTLIYGLYRQGEGYLRDHVHGGMQHYLSTPETMTPQILTAGFEVLETISAPTLNRPSALTPWHYYVCRKLEKH